MATNPRKNPPPHTGQRRPTSEFLQPPATYAVRLINIDGEEGGALATCSIFDPNTGNVLGWAEGLDPLPDVPNGFFILEDGIEVDVSYEYAVIPGGALQIFFSDLPLTVGALYTVYTMSPVNWLLSAEGTGMAPFVQSYQN